MKLYTEEDLFGIEPVKYTIALEANETRRILDRLEETDRVALVAGPITIVWEEDRDWEKK